jgi:hypothetical protein
MSGYRDKDTYELIFTTEYPETLPGDEQLTELLPLKDIASANIFDPQRFELNFLTEDEQQTEAAPVNLPAEYEG